ncbi:MAG: ComEA family DNA-binding protein [Anaerolineales bacterium]|jgi:competence ComEA-like helix-hairpin-helix protein|nr:ComEA family DNA-binding protein [Anaerolineales bacterium]MCW5838680.1 ComEA family DNA-binding protein [Anaerolineales bacterium]MCW5886973.1 ComEA family DNA-binding protein [Anaerolineales bacterium]
MAPPETPTRSLSPAWWLLYGVLCGLAGAGLLAYLMAPPRGHAIELEAAPTYSFVSIPVTAVTRTPWPTEAPLWININEATLQDLQKLPNIGPATAQAIVAYRERYGLFTALEDLQNVAGIGPKTYAGLLGFITLESE